MGRIIGSTKEDDDPGGDNPNLARSRRAFPVVNGLLLISLYQPIAYGILLAVLLAIWLGIYTSRHEGFGDLCLTYAELPDPAVHGLNLLR